MSSENVEKGQVWGNKETGETVKVLEVVNETIIVKQDSLGIKYSLPLSEFDRDEIVLLEEK